MICWPDDEFPGSITLHLLCWLWSMYSKYGLTAHQSITCDFLPYLSGYGVACTALHCNTQPNPCPNCARGLSGTSRQWLEWDCPLALIILIIIGANFRYIPCEYSYRQSDKPVFFFFFFLRCSVPIPGCLSLACRKQFFQGSTGQKYGVWSSLSERGLVIWTWTREHEQTDWSNSLDTVVFCILR